MTKHKLLLALNGIINVSGDSEAAELMRERAEALRDLIKAEPEPLAAWINEADLVVIKECAKWQYVPIWEQQDGENERKPITITERVP